MTLFADPINGHPDDSGACYAPHGTYISGRGTSGAGGGSPTPRIDVHSHIAPPNYLAELDGDHLRDIGGAVTGWSLEKMIEDMDEGGTTTAVTTVTTPGFWFGDIDRTRRMVREANDYSAKLVQDHPTRFGMFVALPLPDVEASLREIAYGLDELKGDGIGLFTNYRDIWLGDPQFDPVYEELNRRKAVIYVHPESPACCKNLIPDLRDATIEYGADTARAIARTVFSGTASKYPDIKFIWSHAGGTVPFLTERFIRLPNLNPSLKEKLPNGVLHELQKFHYDTAQTAHVYAMSSLTKLVSAAQILFGTDYPFRKSKDHVDGLRDCGCFTDAELRAIDYENAHRLLPRVRAIS
ncbi:MAG: amidohydrolase family protein [Proteobacteria bacterium]|nr:amidohydrolase family protein [Pseudomonadota bacterium]